ncbi:sulfite exporter TauE/SafE family protein [Chitinivorax sp. PXF-14]|uniref:sulfite exporter TauE/SafE family protein n=1 Tax=Chitinivorax sp. PXF-14 TaxID=3230488 RepID=UPI003467ADFD
MTYFPLYLAVGAGAGFLAGLLGVGGGLVIVPALVFAFEAQHLPHVLHLALGTSLASILFTSLSSIRGHHARGAVNWRIVRDVTPGILLGTLVGATIVSQLPTRPLKIFFTAFVFYVGIQMLANVKPKPSRELPGKGGMFAAGNVIGGVSSFVGIGGGSLSVPFMSWCNVKIHEAIGTSAAIGFPIALAGAAGYVVNGLAVGRDLPEWTLGFVYLPALAGIAAMSVLTAGLGARAAHRLPVAALKKTFAVLLLGIGAKMLWSLF